MELFALTYMLKQWRPYLLGREFIIKTDHSPLTHYHSQERLTDKLVRQLDFISEFKFKCLHIPGKEQTAADGLSRRPDHYLDSDGSPRSLVGKTILQDVGDILEEPAVNTLISSREYCENVQRRLNSNLEQHQQRQAARTKLLKKSDAASIHEYVVSNHLPLDTEEVIVLKEDVDLMHNLGHVDPSCQKSEEVKAVYDRLAIMNADILLALMAKDELIVKEIRKSYKTDLISKAVLADPPSKSSKYQVIGGLIYGLKRDGGKALYIPETAQLQDAAGHTWNMRELLCYECHDSPIAGHIGIARMRC